jgi:hypothetical protein
MSSFPSFPSCSMIRCGEHLDMASGGDEKIAENQETESFHVGWTQGDDLVWNDGEEIGRMDGLEGSAFVSFFAHQP